MPDKIAIISDLHANIEAAEEVFADIEVMGINHIIGLGDTVGYGPDPEKTAHLMMARRIPTVMGNHELAMAGGNYRQRLNKSALESIFITETLLSPPVRAYLKSLPPVLIRDGIRFVHGCPPDSIETYLVFPEASRLRRIFSMYKERLCFFGHTHQLAIFELDPATTRIADMELLPGRFELRADRRYLINVGSVGQPRDGINNFAKYVVYDRANSAIEVRQIRYDAEKTAEKIIKLGFPEFNAQRLLR